MAPLTEITEKQCTLCKQIKPVADFVSQFTTGYTNRCALCRERGQRAHRKYVRKNLDSIHRYQAEYIQERVSAAVGKSEQTCIRCLAVLPIDVFPIGTKGVRLKTCPKCREYGRKYQALWRKDKPELAVAQSAKASARNREARRQCFEHYGLQCACCDEEHYEFLAIDHVDGNGGKHRSELHPSSIYRWLISNNFPPGFRTLCWNCNWSYGAYGYCPHQKAKLT